MYLVVDLLSTELCTQSIILERKVEFMHPLYTYKTRHFILPNLTQSSRRQKQKKKRKFRKQAELRTMMDEGDEKRKEKLSILLTNKVSSDKIPVPYDFLISFWRPKNRPRASFAAT